MQHLFIPNPSAATREALQDIGYQVTAFTDAGNDGVLTLSPVEDLDYLTTALEQLAGQQLVRDLTPPESEGIIRARALTREEFKSYQYTLAADAILQSRLLQATGDGTAVTQLRGQLTERTRNLALLVQEHAQGYDPNRELRERVASEFDAILKHPQVTRIEVGTCSVSRVARGEGFRIHTTELSCRHPETGVIHSIGEFEISFLFTSPEDAVMWINKTHKIVAWQGDVMQAPHVFKDGHACLGNMAGKYRQLLTRGDYFAAVDMAIRFIESVNITDSAGKYLNRWPVKRG